jgi:hypothetical protein
MPEAIPRDMSAELETFDREAGEILTGFIGDLKSKPPPPILYHYTTDVGLRGILESGKLWLTDIFSLNYPSELKHGFSALGPKAVIPKLWRDVAEVPKPEMVRDRPVWRRQSDDICACTWRARCR